MPNRANILLVDDRPENLLALEAVLESLGQNLVEARTGEEALGCLLQQDFALILMDVQMPDMDGFETAALIRRRQRSRHIPIIFVTAVNRSETHAARGYSLGAVDYISKPIDPDILRAKVSVFIELYRKRQELAESEAELRRLNETLEQRVRERTREVVEMNRELTRSNEELQSFAYVASHDLQEPLRMVGSYAQLLAKRYRGQLDKDADEFIGYMVGGVSHMQRLLTDLLAYSRVGTRARRPQPTCCDTVLSQVLSALRTAVEESGATVTWDPLPTVDVDPSQLTQVFQNLVGNALKFRGDQPPVVHVGAHDEGSEWLFSVRDNGIGIDPRYLDRVFVVFQRLHARGEYPGTGIGLAICKKIVEGHNGRIWAESRPGEGTVLYFTLPKAPVGEEKGLAAEAPRVAESGSPGAAEELEDEKTSPVGSSAGGGE